MTADFSQWHIERLPLADSTNRLAADRILAQWKSNQSAHGLVIVAERQSAGRGQHGRSWESPPGGLYLSAVTESIIPPYRDKVALLAGVATADALLQSEKLRAALRWPNDILLNDKKVGGILCESIVQGDRYAAIIGIGLNINTRIQDLPPSIQRRATSLFANDNRPHNIRTIENALLESLGRALRTLASSGLTYIINRARQLDSLAGKPLEFQDGPRHFTGIARGLGEQGELLIEVDNHLRPFSTGTIIAIAGERIRG